MGGTRTRLRGSTDLLAADPAQWALLPGEDWHGFPPGIATVVPGERLDGQASPMIAYLKAFERAANLFPGFDNEVQGLYRKVKDGVMRFHTYVVRE